jgi:UbiD family decarboxylase
VVDRRVSTDFEVTRFLREDLSRPVFFKDVDGHEVVGNLWATRERLAWALGTSREKLLYALLEALRRPADFEVVDRAPFMAHTTKDFDLRKLPIPRWYPGEPGRYLTSGVVVAEWEGKRNMSFHRMLLLDGQRVAARIVPRHLYAMHRKALEAGQDLKLGVVVGPDPWLLLAAGTSVEYEADELRIAAALERLTQGRTLEAVKLRNGVTVPASADYAFEARLTGERHAEGPFVDGTGTYDRQREEPVMVFERMFHIDRPIFHAILSGGREHFMLMGLPREPVIYESVKKVVPEVTGVRLTEGSGAWLHGIVGIKQQREGDGKNALLAAFAGHPSMKMCIVVDEDIDVFDDRDVDWAVATRFQADRDLVVITGARGSSIDPSAEDGITAKMGIDATKPMGRPEFEKPKV